jgi:nitrogen fixation/metabolism regulation signal transduction histidine kinase
MRRLRTLPLAVRLLALASLCSVLASACSVILMRWLAPWLAATLATAMAVVMTAVLIHRSLIPVRALFRALAGTVASYRDGDFSFGINWTQASDLRELVEAHNALGNTLREQRQSLVQRELLLDTMVQNTPVAMVLIDPNRRVVLGNLAARKLLGEGRRLEGRAFEAIVANTAPAMREAIMRGGEGMFTVPQIDDEDIYHLSRRSFRLNGRNHELILLRQLTVELRRQEVQVWKKVIRVISHELNNSLAPIASLAHSGAELLRRGQTERLPVALATIEERARHLEGFIRDYARFAKLPTPRIEAVAWHAFVAQLSAQIQFTAEIQPPGGVGHFDAAQIEQALINLLKNAHESGSAAETVQLSIRRSTEGWRIEILDRGQGMNEAVLANALLPFYSTKRHGTGLGLALSREIIEAHGGRITLLNRDGGGLCVALVLPL